MASRLQLSSRQVAGFSRLGRTPTTNPFRRGPSLVASSPLRHRAILSRPKLAPLTATSASPAPPNGTGDDKARLVLRLLEAKEATGLSFDEIALELGLTNTYTAQLFYNQAQLKPGTADKLASIIPSISAADLALMQRAPMRSFNESVLQEPLVYRLNEAVNHYADSLKAIINEEFGDGIMSAIDFYMTVDKVVGMSGEDRVVITFNGKFLPHVEQRIANDTSRGSK